MVFGGLKAVDDLSFDVKEGKSWPDRPQRRGNHSVQLHHPVYNPLPATSSTAPGRQCAQLNNHEVHKIITKVRAAQLE